MNESTSVPPFFKSEETKPVRGPLTLHDALSVLSSLRNVYVDDDVFVTMLGRLRDKWLASGCDHVWVLDDVLRTFAERVDARSAFPFLKAEETAAAPGSVGRSDDVAALGANVSERAKAAAIVGGVSAPGLLGLRSVDAEVGVSGETPAPPYSRCCRAKVSRGPDWLNATLTVGCDEKLPDFSVLLEMLLKSDREAFGKRGYRGFEIAGEGRFLSRRAMRERDVVHPGGCVETRNEPCVEYWIELPAESLRVLVAAGRDLLKVFRAIHGAGFHATIIHVAMDTTDTAVNPWVAETHRRRRAFVSKTRMGNFMRDFAPHGDKLLNGVRSTCYFGKLSQNRVLRVYDRQWKIIKLGGDDPGHLTRFELELKQEAARQAFETIVEDGFDAIPGILRGFIEFKPLRGRTEAKKREGVPAWWRRLVGGARKVCPDLTRKDVTAKKQARWIRNQAARAIAMMVEYCPEEIEQIVAEGGASAGAELRESYELEFTPAERGLRIRNLERDRIAAERERELELRAEALHFLGSKSLFDGMSAVSGSLAVMGARDRKRSYAVAFKRSDLVAVRPSSGPS